MKTTKKPLIIFAIISLVFAIAFSVIRYKIINEKYPQKIINRYDIGETMIYKDYAFDIVQTKMMKYWDFKKEYNYKDTYGLEVYVDENETHVFILTMSITNLKNEESPMPFCGYFSLQTNSGYSTNLDLLMMKNFFYNEDMSQIVDDLMPYESRTIIIPYTIDAHYLDVYDGVILNQDSFSYVISLYPEKNYFDL